MEEASGQGRSRQGSVRGPSSFTLILELGAREMNGCILNLSRGTQSWDRGCMNHRETLMAGSLTRVMAEEVVRRLLSSEAKGRTYRSGVRVAPICCLEELVVG